MDELDGERIVVTGASKGLGREMALRYLAEGARVGLLARSEDDLRAVAERGGGQAGGNEAGSDGAGGEAGGYEEGEALVLPTDVTEADAVEGAISRVVEAWGGVDTLVNNAGIGLLSLYDEGRPVHEIDREDWGRIMAVNLDGVFHCTSVVLPHMLAQGRGNVVNVSSGWGRHASPGYAPYVTSKHGLEGFTRTAALDYADDGINVNCLDPGGRTATAFWDHLPDEERADLLPSDVMNDAAVLLAAQGPDGVSGESMPAAEWEARLG